MGDKELAQKIIELVGNKENIVSVRHCATRLRIVVRDKDKIQVKMIESIEKVKGSFFNSGQYQIILGTGLVNRIYNEVINIIGESNNADEVKYGNSFQRAIRMFSDVFVPIIPVLVATGLFMGVRGLLMQDAVLAVLGIDATNIPESMLTFSKILTDTAFAFLPALVCWSTFRNFGGSPVIGMVLGLMLVSPSLPSAYDVGAGKIEPLLFFDYIKVSGYQGSVLPAFVTGVLAAKFECWVRKHIPDVVDLIITPFLTLLVGIVLALFVLGPILHWLELELLFLVKSILFLPFGIGGLLYGCFGQLFGIFGIHHIFNFLEISMLAQDGWNYLNPIGTCGNVAQVGAVLAVAIKAVSNKVKQVAYPSCLSALLGITEPAVFGVNLKFIRPFVCAMIGGGVGGFLASNLQLKAIGMSITGIPGTLLYLNEQLPFYILVNVISFAVAFTITWFFGYNSKMETGTEKVEQEENNAINKVDLNENNKVVEIASPLKGEVLPLNEVKDEAFASGILGNGIAINPKEGVLVSPVNGVVNALLPTLHAIGITTQEGVELLIHIGMDTVKLKGEGFKAFVKQGDEIKIGQKLIEFDIDLLKSKGYCLDVPIVITNMMNYTEVVCTKETNINIGENLLSIK